MYTKKALRDAPAKWVDPFTRTEVLSMEHNKDLNVVATYRRNGRVNRSTVRLDSRGDRYFPACGERCYIADLRAGNGVRM